MTKMKIIVKLEIPDDEVSAVQLMLATLANQLNEQARNSKNPRGVHQTAEVLKDIYNGICDGQNWERHQKRMKVAA
jgi:hypothetical protein